MDRTNVRQLVALTSITIAPTSIGFALMIDSEIAPTNIKLAPTGDSRDRTDNRQ